MKVTAYFTGAAGGMQDRVTVATMEAHHGIYVSSAYGPAPTFESNVQYWIPDMEIEACRKALQKAGCSLEVASPLQPSSPVEPRTPADLEARDRIFPSTSDRREVNNIMRHEYRVLTDSEKHLMQKVKDHGLEFVEMLHGVGGTPTGSDRQATRELALAQTKIEEAVMWAVKHITR